MIKSRFFRRKTLDISGIETEGGLKRSLSATDLTLLGVGGIIGAGIFVLTGQAAALHSGPAIILSFILAGIACGLAAYCYSELASMIPIAGSAYTYSYIAFGEVVAWIIGWAVCCGFPWGSNGCYWLVRLSGQLSEYVWLNHPPFSKQCFYRKRKWRHKSSRYSGYSWLIGGAGKGNPCLCNP